MNPVKVPLQMYPVEGDKIIKFYRGLFDGVVREANESFKKLKSPLMTGGVNQSYGKSSNLSQDVEYRKALVDIKYYENERRNINKSTNDAIKASNRALYNQVVSETKLEESLYKSKVNTILSGLKQIQNAQNSSSKSSLANSFLGSFGGNLVSDAVSKITSVFQQGASVILDYSANLEQAQIGFETLLGSSQLAQQHLKDLQDFAKTTPFQFEDLVEASRRLQGVGIEAQRVIPILTGVGNAASSAGMSAEEIKGITVALSQVAAKGKLAAQEVNQFGERGIPLWTALSQATGKSRAELIKMAEAGQISSELVIATFQKIYGENSKFGDAMEKQSHTFLGSLSNITDALKQVASTAFKPYFDQVSRLGDDTAKKLNQAKDFEQVGKIISEQIGYGITKAAGGLGYVIVDELTKSISDVFTDKSDSFIDKIADAFVEGIDRALGESLSSIEIGGRKLFTKEDLVKDFGFSPKLLEAEKQNQLIYKSFDSSKIGSQKPDAEISRLLSEGSKSGKFKLSSKAEAIVKASNELGVSALDLAAIISYETSGTFSSSIKGGKGGNYQGAIQFGASERKQFGVYEGQSFENQVTTSVVEYFKNRFNSVGRTTQGATLSDLYKTVNGGNPNVSGRAPDGNGTIDQHVQKIASTHRANALSKLFGGSLSNIPSNETTSNDYLAQLKAIVEFDNQQYQKELFEKSNKFFTQFGITPNNDYLKRYTDFLNKDIPQDRNKLNLFDVKTQFQKNKQLGASAIINEVQPIATPDTFRGTLGDDYVKNLKEYLDVSTKIEEIFARNEKHSEIVSEHIKDAKVSQESILQTLGEQYEVQQNLFKDEQYRKYEKDIKILQEKTALEREIFDIENDLSIQAEATNDSLKIQLAYLQDVYDLRNRELNAVIQINRATLELSQANVYSANQVKAQVLSEISNEVGNINSALASGIIDAFRKGVDYLDNRLGKIGEIPILGDILKFGNRQFLGSLTTTLVDAFLPSDLAEKFKDSQMSVSDKISKSNEYLKRIADAVTPSVGGISIPGLGGFGGGGGAGGAGGGNIIQNLLSGFLGSNKSGGVSTDSILTADSITGGAEQLLNMGGSSSRSGILGMLGGLNTKIFGSQGFGFGNRAQAVGTIQGIGGLASLAGGFVPGVGGSILSGVGSGIGAASSLSTILGISAIGGPAGLIIGGAIGGLIGLGSWLFGSSKQRKQDEATRTQAYQSVVSQFDEMIAKLKTIPPGISSAEAQTRGSQLISEYNVAMSQLKDSKTRNIALGEVTNTNGIIYRKNQELQAAIAIAQANEFSKLKNSGISGEFAGGIFVNDAFRNQFDEFKRYEGLLGGTYTGKDYIKALIGDGEMLLNPKHIRNVINNAGGRDVFAGADIPNYNKPAPPKPSLPKFAGGVSFASSVSSSNSPVQPQLILEKGAIEIYLNGERITDAQIEKIAIRGVTQFKTTGGRTV